MSLRPRREPAAAKRVPGSTKDGEIATFVVPDLSIKDLLSVIPCVPLFDVPPPEPRAHTRLIAPLCYYQPALLQALCCAIRALRVSASAPAGLDGIIKPTSHFLPQNLGLFFARRHLQSHRRR